MLWELSFGAGEGMSLRRSVMQQDARGEARDLDETRTVQPEKVGVARSKWSWFKLKLEFSQEIDEMPYISDITTRLIPENLLNPT